MRRLQQIVLFLGCWSLVLVDANAGQTFTPISDSSCSNSATFSGWAVGEQYVDSNNGVPVDQWSMLVRWQGKLPPLPTFVTNPVSYELGAATGLFGAVQRGVQPEIPASGTPGVQIKCNGNGVPMDAGMLINTWPIPHRPIVGGGYNDMFGYKWSDAYEPRIFESGDDIVIQANLCVPWYQTWGSGVFGSVHFFAYLRDMSDLTGARHPIAVIATAYDAKFSGISGGSVNFDYSPDETNYRANLFPGWVQPDASGGGVWFGAGYLNKSLPSNYIKIIHEERRIESALAPESCSSMASRFWRVHISPENINNIVREIENYSCGPGHPNQARGCPTPPARGYSRRARDYSLQYAGVIAEIVIDDGLLPASFDSPTYEWQGGPGDASKQQGSIGLNVNGLGIFRYDEVRVDSQAVSGFYTGLLGRQPDQGGYAGWLGYLRDARCNNEGNLNGLWSALNMQVALFVWSEEFLARGLSNADFVSSLYMGILRRQPESIGHAYWTNMLDSGYSREDVRLAFVYSQEFQNITVAPILGAACI